MSQHIVPAQEWWTAEEVAASGLPDLPGTRQGVDALIKRLQWRLNPVLARRRAGKGGGWEYSWRLFPARAQRKLLQAVTTAVQPARMERDEAWAWYEALPQAVKDRTQARLVIVQQVEALEPALGRHLAVVDAARVNGIGARTVWSWFSAIEGVRADDRLPYLAPRNRASAEKPRSKDCDPEFFAVLKADYLRLEAPPFTDCFRRSVRIAKDRGWEVLPERTMRRRLDATVSAVTQLLARKGTEAVKRAYPPQVRDKSDLHAMQAVNADFHKFDVFVRWPGPVEGQETIIRPQMVAFQDIYSGRIVAWRLDINPNSTAVLLAAGDMISEFGIPEHVLLDNGREFAAKAITGGAATRYRFKVKEEDIPGLFVQLGCKIHWASPYHGQAKPIERAFRDMCQSIAKDPRFAGAYTGNRPEAKPENYGSKAVELKLFLSVLAEGIQEHNTRTNRKSEIAYGRSFAAVFDESYAQHPVRKATAAQRRLWLLGAEGMRADRSSGAVWFQGNEFWDHWMHEIAGQRVVVRFDPAAFWDGVHIYSAEGAYLGHAPVRQKKGFFDMDEARAEARARSAWMKAEKAALEAERRYKAHELGDMLDAIAQTPAEAVNSKVVKPTFGRGKGLPPARPRPAPAYSEETVQEVQATIVADLAERRAAAQPAAEETAAERFERALDLEARIVAGKPVTTDQQRWLAAYQDTPEYISQRMFRDDFGDKFSG